jgi:hypothetical protein
VNSAAPTDCADAFGHRAAGRCPRGTSAIDRQIKNAATGGRAEIQVSKRSDKGCVGIAERIRFISVLSSDP